ncbi:NAD-dependent 15-hydroxyprostaglandin dehydrogenase [Colletotrichum graminicola M1.001]|uniref:NAD-dependent 15-hydroxyprostaglandin dehydrogenase n=1 Tax=Colletotrichum graminicola (strain M1.001 / M2 / FGSC 10212) TaxID=645133 RepID=E3QJP8_COLGM|nr:NAD-dependent 15-hydroxyprostaglandin dehydrogenase [Colletotrichum graminicola M1.001]EFQ31086.1 NAD-dependent 15-hydroxyprostaglandin dehydrogenase [Colletotrichum graminicola M1.001]
MSRSVQGKSAIVTGSSSGINLAFAALLLAKGCNVAFADLTLRPEAQDVVMRHAQAAPGKGRAVFQQTDVQGWT